MSDIEPLPPEVEILALAAIEAEVKKRKEMAKALIGQRYPDGHRESFRSPVTAAKLGMVYRSDPEPTWVVSDRDALRAHLREFPGNLTVTVTILPEDMPEALAVIAEHAPGLLTDLAELDPDAVKAALDQSEATGEPAAPGISRVKPSGVLTAKPAADAMAEVGRLIVAGVLTWDARPVLEQAERQAS